MTAGKISSNISVADVEPVKRILEAIKAVGSVEPDGHFCTCQKKCGNPMFPKHTKSCVELHEAIKELK
jgi:hypothetical protein